MALLLVGVAVVVLAADQRRLALIRRQPAVNQGFSCGSTGNQFWDNLVATAYTIYSKSLRTAGQLDYEANGGLVANAGCGTEACNFWSYDATEDAALLSIPEYYPTTAFTLAADITNTTTTSVTVSGTGGMDPGDQFKCSGSSEQFTWVSGSSPNLTVTRGVRGSSATTHLNGETCQTSINSSGNDIRLPSSQSEFAAGTGGALDKDGDDYLIVWDTMFDEGYRVSRSGMSLDVYKHVQFWSPNYAPGPAETRWIEHRVGFCDGCASTQPPTFDPVAPSPHVAYLDYRCYGGGGGDATWANQTGGKMQWGPNATVDGTGTTCFNTSGKVHFIVDHSVWVRRTLEINTQTNNYDLVTGWAKSEAGSSGSTLTKLIDALQGSMRKDDSGNPDTDRRMNRLQLEIDSSKQSILDRESGNVLKQWFRNVWIGKNVPTATRDQMLACDVNQ